MYHKTRSMILAALFAALTAVGAFLKIPIGPAPITLQFFFTALSGVLLGPFLGSLSQLLYVALGLIGIPIFTSGGGPSYIFNPTFGYLLGYIVAPLVIGGIYARFKKPTILRIFAACVLGAFVVYAFGVPYMYMILRCVTHTSITFAKTLVIGCLVFLPGDAIKCIAAALIGVRMAPMLRRTRQK